MAIQFWNQNDRSCDMKQLYFKIFGKFLDNLFIGSSLIIIDRVSSTK